MKQQCAFLHTAKGLKEAEEILQKEGMEIILKTTSMQINYSDLTEAEQFSWLKMVRNDFEAYVDDIEILYRKVELFLRKKPITTDNFRKMLEELPKNTIDNKEYKNLAEKFLEFFEDSKQISDGGHPGYATRRLDRILSCSCIIARKGSDFVRYLEFYRDPVLTIKGPNATSLKSSLESKF